MEELKKGQYFQCIGDNVQALECFAKSCQQFRLLYQADKELWMYFYCEATTSYAIALESTNMIDIQEELFEELDKINPKGFHIGDYAMFIHKRKKDYIKANIYYSRAVELYPNHSTVLFRYAGFLRHILNDIPKAELYYEAAVTANPHNVDAVGALASFLHGVKQNYSRAETLYEQCIALDETHLNNLCNYGLFLSEQKQLYEYAEQIFLKAICIVPKHTNTLYNFAVMLDTHCNRKQEGERLYRQVIEQEGSHTYALYNLAQLLETKLKDLHDAEVKSSMIKEIQGLYNALMRADKSDAVACGDYGRFLLLHTTFYKNAEKLLVRAIALDDELEVGLYYLGVLNHRYLKDAEKSEFFLRRLLYCKYTHISGLRLLADVLQSKLDTAANTAFEEEVMSLYERAATAPSVSHSELSAILTSYTTFIKSRKSDCKMRGVTFIESLKSREVLINSSVEQQMLTELEAYSKMLLKS